MRSFTNRLGFMKLRRASDFVILICCALVIVSMASKWSSSSLSDDAVQHLTVHSNISPEQPTHVHANEPIKRNYRGQPNLPKYIHLDLKGAPPQADQFYDRFFHFVDGLKMGVRGVLIEYEDMLPLRGRLSNVSRDECEPPLDSLLF